MRTGRRPVRTARMHAACRAAGHPPVLDDQDDAAGARPGRRCTHHTASSRASWSTAPAST